MATNAVPPHTHDDRYVSKREYGVRTEATRTVFGQQRKWPIPNGYSLLLPDADIDANAEIAIEDGGELALVGGGGLPDHTDLLGLTDDDHIQYLLASTYGGRSAFTTNWTDLTDAGATTLHKHDHGGQDGLGDDDHTQYPLLLGRSGGQTLIGGTAANDDLTLEGTSNATKATSYVILQPTSGNVGIGTSAPASKLHIGYPSTLTLDLYTGTPKFRLGGIPGVGSWGATFLNASFNGSAWDLDDTAKDGWFFKLDSRATGVSALNGLWLYRIPAGANSHTDEYAAFGVTDGNAYFKDNVGIGVDPATGKLDVRQTSTTAAVPTVVLNQADLSEEFIEFNGTVSAGNPIDTAALGAYYGKIRVSVNGTFKYIALYDS